MKQKCADVIVIGAGPAGLAASIAAAENGLHVLAFEKSNVTGGTANMGMGIFAVGSSYQKEAFVGLTSQEAFEKHMEYTHYRVNAALIKAYFDKSADTVEWLKNMGVEFFGAYKYFEGSEQTWHIVKNAYGAPGPRAAANMYKVMTEKAMELGVEFFFETPVQNLIVEDGCIAGAIGTDKTGEEIHAKGKAVVVATGGFGGNEEMIQEELGYKLGTDYFPFAVPGITGDGLRMCWKYGAEKYGINAELIYQVPDNVTWFCIDAVMRQPNLLINQKGQRFMNEAYMENTTYTGNAINQQPGRYAYAILDERILHLYEKKGMDCFSLVHSPNAIGGLKYQIDFAREQNYPHFFEADTVKELADKLAIPNDVLQETLDDYNELCDSNMDTQFGKPQKYLKRIGKGKLYAARFFVGAYGSLGGLRINEHCQVLDHDQNPIAGLYAAGTDANTIYGDSYNFYLPGNSMGFAVNSGRMAGEAIAQQLA